MHIQEFSVSPDIDPISIFKVVRQRFGIPTVILESMSFDERNQMSIIATTPIQEVITHTNSFEQIRHKLANTQEIPDYFPFSGGLIGYFNFEIFNEIEPEKAAPKKSDYPNSIFYEFARFFVFDHENQKLICFQTTQNPNFKTENNEVVQQAEQVQNTEIDIEQFQGNDLVDFTIFEMDHDLGEFQEKMQKAKQAILDGEIFQLILSNGFRKELSDIDGIECYEILRKLEPTTHLYFLDFGDEKGKVIGASIEILGSKRDDQVLYRPIAGTRYRGVNEEHEKEIEREFLDSEKEHAEHDMLLDLGRNDLGKICQPSSVKILREKYIKKFANVMHLVSDLGGTIQTEYDGIDFFESIFPAGTLSGAPKIRAIQLIQELEPFDRNLYGGAVGYFSKNGNMEFAIAIRSFLLQDGVAKFRTGAGIVQDSTPKGEWLEIHNKAKTLCKVINYISKN